MGQGNSKEEDLMRMKRQKSFVVSSCAAANRIATFELFRLGEGCSTNISLWRRGRSGCRLPSSGSWREKVPEMTSGEPKKLTKRSNKHSTKNRKFPFQTFWNGKRKRWVYHITLSGSFYVSLCEIWGWRPLLGAVLRIFLSVKFRAQPMTWRRFGESCSNSLTMTMVNWQRRSLMVQRRFNPFYKLQELVSIEESLGVNISEAEAAEIIQRYDTDGNNLLSLEEFIFYKESQCWSDFNHALTILK